MGRCLIRLTITILEEVYSRYHVLNSIQLNFIYLTLTFPCDGGKVLVFPVDESHWLNMKVLVKALHSQGHQITVLRSSTSWYISEFSPYYTSITIIHEESQPVESQDFMSSFLKRSVVKSVYLFATKPGSCGKIYFHHL